MNARELAADLATHGLRFDLNPTVNSADLHRSFIDYIARMDAHARAIGQSISDLLDEEEPA